jgi:anti-sigma28 factor (negative regulator of flagellin synthesis)
MSGINGVGNNPGVQRVVAPTVTRPSAPPDAPARSGSVDKLELSGASHLLKSLKDNDVRTDKVAFVRAAIDAGTYEDDYKLDTAIDRLLDDLER